MTAEAHGLRDTPGGVRLPSPRAPASGPRAVARFEQVDDDLKPELEAAAAAADPTAERAAAAAADPAPERAPPAAADPAPEDVAAARAGAAGTDLAGPDWVDVAPGPARPGSASAASGRSRSAGAGAGPGAAGAEGAGARAARPGGAPDRAGVAGTAAVGSVANPPSPANPPSRANSPGPASTPALPTLQQRLRGLAARVLMAVHRQPDSGALGPLVSVHQAVFPDADVALLSRAYAVAEAHHRGQVRKSGEPFITHPLAVATILAELGMDTTTLVAALLHDTVEDTGYTIAQSQADFGMEVAHLVDGVTKLDKVRFGEAAEAETIRKMIVAGGRDLRVLVIKLADRLHNMRTLRYQPLHKRQHTARATMDFLVPLADRLGVHVLKGELESLCFATLEPEAFAQVVRLIAARAPARAAYLAGVVRQVDADLVRAEISAVVSERARHFFSVHKTTVERGGVPGQALDAPRALIVVRGEPGECYAALGVVHGRWRPVPGRFKDYIALPKFNMYQSLHTTVRGPGGESVDVLIRTEAMHRVAEYGVAAHVREAAMAAGEPPHGPAARPSDLEWLRRLLEWQREVDDAGEFFRTLRSELGGDREVLVFSTGGEARTLPDGATPVDLAYAIRSDVGHRTVGARVNGRLVSLSSPLADGDVVEILTSESENPGPSASWLEFVRSPHAHVRIRQWFAEQSRDGVIEHGRELLERRFARAGRSLDSTVDDGSLLVTALELGYRQPEELYAAVAERAVSVEQVLERTARHAPPDSADPPA